MGELRFVGRKSDVIVTAAGMNVHPEDLEAALAGQAGMRGAVVVGCEFAAGPEAVAVVLFAGTEEELRAAVEKANTGWRSISRYGTGALAGAGVSVYVDGEGGAAEGEGVGGREDGGRRRRSPLYVEGSENGRDGVWGVVAEVAGKAVEGVMGCGCRRTWGWIRWGGCNCSRRWTAVRCGTG